MEGVERNKKRKERERQREKVDKAVKPILRDIAYW